MSTYSSSKSETVQQDQRTMAEQAEVIAGPASTIAYPGSIVLGQDAQTGSISFVTHQAETPGEGLNNQLSSVLSALMNQPATIPAAAQVIETEKDKSKLILYAAIGIAAIFLLRSL